MLPEHALRAGYFAVLNGAIISNNRTVTVYDAFSVPETKSYPFILIGSIQTIEIANDNCKFYRASVTVDIVTGNVSPVGRTEAWEIGYEVEKIINPDDMSDIDLTLYGWYVGETRLESASNLESKAKNFYIYRNIRTYSHLITKQNA